jgi:drug/metabolite transporter (DMT)-like permease
MCSASFSFAGGEAPALVAALGTVVLWSSAFVGIRSAGRSLSPEALALGRLLVSSVALGAFAAVRRERLSARRDLARIAFTACSGSSSTTSS